MCMLLLQRWCSVRRFANELREWHETFWPTHSGWYRETPERYDSICLRLFEGHLFSNFTIIVNAIKIAYRVQNISVLCTYAVALVCEVYLVFICAVLSLWNFSIVCFVSLHLTLHWTVRLTDYSPTSPVFHTTFTKSMTPVFLSVA